MRPTELKTGKRMPSISTFSVQWLRLTRHADPKCSSTSRAQQFRAGTCNMGYSKVVCGICQRCRTLPRAHMVLPTRGGCSVSTKAPAAERLARGCFGTNGIRGRGAFWISRACKNLEWNLMKRPGKGAERCHHSL
jgi:hypothetical protein